MVYNQRGSFLKIFCSLFCYKLLCFIHGESSKVNQNLFYTKSLIETYLLEIVNSPWDRIVNTGMGRSCEYKNMDVDKETLFTFCCFVYGTMLFCNTFAHVFIKSWFAFLLFFSAIYTTQFTSNSNITILVLYQKKMLWSISLKYGIKSIHKSLSVFLSWMQ